MQVLDKREDHVCLVGEQLLHGLLLVPTSLPGSFLFMLLESELAVQLAQVWPALVRDVPKHELVALCGSSKVDR